MYNLTSYNILHYIILFSVYIYLDSWKDGKFFRCANENSIQMYKVCDGVDNCLDNSDELLCGQFYNPIENDMLPLILFICKLYLTKHNIHIYSYLL